MMAVPLISIFAHNPMPVAIEEVLSPQEIAELDSGEAVSIARDVLQKIKEESTRLLIDPSQEMGSLIASSRLFEAKVRYLKRRFAGARGDFSLLSSEELKWINDLDRALRTYVQHVIAGLTKTLPYVLGHEAVKIIDASEEMSKLLPQHALIGLLIGAQEVKSILTDKPHGFSRFADLFFASVFSAQQVFRMWKMGAESIGGSNDLSKLHWVKEVVEYVGGGTLLATQLCEEMGLSPVGKPLVTILEHDNPPLLCIEYLLDASPQQVCEANDKLSKSIALSNVNIPHNFHVCFGVA